MHRQKVIGLIAVLFGLAGCSQEKELGEFDVSEIKSLQVTGSIGTMTNPATGQVMRRELPEGYIKPGFIKPGVDVVTGGSGYKNSEWQSTGIAMPTHRSPGFRGPDADYIDKADVYWKLNWIRIQLQNGKLPSNLKEAVAKTRKLLRTVVQDRNSNTAEEAVIALEEGIEHLEAQRVLTLGNTDLQLIPWRAGRAAVERYFEQDNGKLNGGASKSNKYLNRSGGSLTLDLMQNPLSTPHPSGRSLTTKTAPGVTEAQAVALSYASKFAASPEEMMRRSWQKAIEKTNKLRDDLGLMNRADNNDRNDVSVPTVFGTTTEPQNTTEEKDTTMDSVVPIPSIYGDTHRANVPASAFKEPSDPFGKP